MFDYWWSGQDFPARWWPRRWPGDSTSRCMLVDRRSHVGGNAYDHRDEAGVLVQSTAPTSSTPIRRMSSTIFRSSPQWRNYEHRVLASVDGKLVPIPINLDTVNMLHGLNLTVDELEAYLESIAEKRAVDPNFGRCGGQPRRARSLREDVPRLHPQAVGPGSFGTGCLASRREFRCE